MKLAKVSTSHVQAVTGTTFVSTLSSLLFGYCMGVMTGVVAAIDHSFVAPRNMGAGASNLLLGFAVCAALLGSVVGSLCARRAADIFGRKRTMIIAAVLFLVSAFGSAFPEIGLHPLGALSPEVIWPFICYRVLGGIAVGLASVIAPMYVAEFAPSAVRGQLGAYQQVAIAGGFCLALFVNWGIALQGDDAWLLEAGWRYMMLSVAVPAMAFFCLSFTVPESPSWLVSRGRIEEARSILSRSGDPHEVSVTVADLVAQHNAQPAAAPLLAFGARVVFVGVALSVLQQIVGTSAIIYYGPQILQRMGYHLDAAFLGVLIARSLNVLATMVVVLIVDRVGRKPLLIFGALIMGSAMVGIGTLLESGHHGPLGLVAICCYLAAVGMSFGPIVWILMSEIFPAAIRGRAMSLAIAAQWTANFVVTATFPVMFGDSTLNAVANGGFAFFVYGAFAILAAFVVLGFVPETKGLDSDLLGEFWGRQSASVTTETAKVQERT